MDRNTDYYPTTVTYVRGTESEELAAAFMQVYETQSNKPIRKQALDFAEYDGADFTDYPTIGTSEYHNVGIGTKIRTLGAEAVVRLITEKA